MSSGLCHCKLWFLSPFVLVSIPKDSTVYSCKDREKVGEHLESASCTQISPSSYQGTSESTISPHSFSLLEITFLSALVNSVKECAGSRGCLDLNLISPSARRWTEWFIIKISYFSSALENTEPFRPQKQDQQQGARFYTDRTRSIPCSKVAHGWQGTGTGKKRK